MTMLISAVYTIHINTSICNSHPKSFVSDMQDTMAYYNSHIVSLLYTFDTLHNKELVS